jgi:hypothetical protein
MLRIAVIALVALNLLLWVLEASKQPGPVPPATAPVAAPLAVPDVPGIRLLSELGEGDGSPGLGSVCFTVGPFDARDAASAARRGLQGLAVAVSERETLEQVERGLRVFIPPFETVQAARAMARNLRAAGIIDVEVISEGEWERTISLGYFLEESNARALTQRARDLGFDARIRVLHDAESRYWLDYAQTVGAPYAARALASTVPPQWHRPIPCDTMSPPEKRIPYSAW